MVHASVTLLEAWQASVRASTLDGTHSSVLDIKIRLTESSYRQQYQDLSSIVVQSPFPVENRKFSVKDNSFQMPKVQKVKSHQSRLYVVHCPMRTGMVQLVQFVALPDQILG